MERNSIGWDRMQSRIGNNRIPPIAERFNNLISAPSAMQSHQRQGTDAVLCWHVGSAAAAAKGLRGG